jgi:hypothetical protein
VEIEPTPGTAETTPELEVLADALATIRHSGTRALQDVTRRISVAAAGGEAEAEVRWRAVGQQIASLLEEARKARFGG